MDADRRECERLTCLRNRELRRVDRRRASLVVLVTSFYHTGVDCCLAVSSLDSKDLAVISPPITSRPTHIAKPRKLILFVQNASRTFFSYSFIDIYDCSYSKEMVFRYSVEYILKKIIKYVLLKSDLPMKCCSRPW